MGEPMGSAVGMSTGSTSGSMVRAARVLAGLVWASMAAVSAQAASVVGVTPQGEVAQVRQITVRFSEAVTPFGDLRQPAPFTVSCQGAVPGGSGRWSTDRVWLYDFSEPLAPGVRCDMKPAAGWKPLTGTLTGTTEFKFNTGGPVVVSMQPGGGTVEEDQHFLARLNGAAVAETVTANAWCEADGIGERLPVKIVTGAVRDQLIKQRKLEKVAARLLVLTCQRPLPNDVDLRVIWGKGIAAAANPGIVTSVEQRFSYHVRKAFSAEFSCEREKAELPCLPIRPMTVSFSAPISRAQADKIRLKPASGDAKAPLFDADDRSDEVSAVTFPTPLPESTAFTIELPADLKDNSGRALANAGSFPLKVATGAMPPIAKFAAAPFGVVELNGDAMLPVTLRHVQPDLRPASAGASAPAGSSGGVRVKRLTSDADILRWYARVAKYDETQLSARELGRPQSEWKEAQEITDDNGRTRTVMVDKMIGTREVSLLKGEADAKRLDLPQLIGGDPRPFEVIGIPLSEPGYQVVEIESARLGASLLDKPQPMYVRTGVLLTNLGVHFKHGRENSLAWVTTLDTGKPVAGAQVTVNDCRGNKLWSGATDAQGIARIEQVLASAGDSCAADDGYFVTARKADTQGRGDVAFVFSSWQKGIESWRFNVPTSTDPEPDTRAHTVFDRTLLRAGETVSMKHFLRMETSSGLAFMKPQDLPTQVKVTHQGTGQSFTQPLVWNGVRSATSTWSIPAAAKLGVYDVTLEREGSADSANGRKRQRSWPSGDIRVEEFRLPLIDARLSGPKAPAVAPTELPIQVQLNYFSGGPMARAPARASALLKSRYVSFPNYDEFSFEPPRQIKADGTTSNDEDSDSENASDPSQKLVLDKQPLTTDANGAATVTLKDLPKTLRPSRVQAEVTYNDPNGEAQTASTDIDLWPSAVVLGVKTG
ncbi:MAG: alpha-2-macroglobulin, partial [Rhizobacter sp.]|nr:alpha-2-macroglobulin [Rhizobacter sp.]